MSSRASSKSSPSSAASQGSNRIDLGKDSGVDMGSKAQPSASSGGIGITQEIITIGGLQIEGGVSVDVSPLDLEISSNGKDKISIGASAEIPGGLLGVAGGVTIDTNTGRIEGGSIGGEVAGIGVEISKTPEGVGVGISFQIPGSPVSIQLGFEFPGKKDLTPAPTPTPSPSPVSSLPPGIGVDDYGAPNFANGCLVWQEEYMFISGEFRNGKYTAFASPFVINPPSPVPENQKIRARNNASLKSNGYTIYSYRAADLKELNYIDISSSFYTYSPVAFGNAFWFTNRHRKVYVKPDNGGWVLLSEETRQIKSDCSPPVFYPPPFPNPPPRKQMDDCCRESMRMLRNLSTVMQVDNVLKGKMQIAGELIAIPEEGKTLPPEILQTYPQMVNAILLAVNRHGMDAPIVVEIEDTDKTTAGDQSAVYTYNSPSVAMQATLEMLHELKAAGNARLSVQIGIAFAVTRILKIVAGASESIREVIKMLGMPFRYKPKKMLLEFNLAGIKKGYGKNSKPKEFSEMSKEELESIVPTLLEGSECDIPVPTFTTSEADDIRQMLCKLTIRKEK